MSLTSLVSPLSSEFNGDKCDECSSILSVTKESSVGFINDLSGAFQSEKPPNIEHELNVAKSLLQQSSSITGDNLFDHLSDIIKRVIDERPENIVDYFEEFSHNIRQQKFRIKEQFPWTYYEPVDIEAAKTFLRSIKVNFDVEYNVCRDEKSNLPRSSILPTTSPAPPEKYKRKLLLNENVLRLNLYWSLCGFGIEPDEVHHLALRLQKIQFHRNIQHARFWGKIYGLRKSYYIVEAVLTEVEVKKRVSKMREEMMVRMQIMRSRSKQVVSETVDLDMFPGIRWQDPNGIQTSAAPLPKVKFDVEFDIPPELMGTGLNRRTYFVVNSLTEDWIELPIVTPKQIQISRRIKKFFTGDLEAKIVSYPCFPGTEKHYLRTIIARISSETYIAPNGYYRRLPMTEEIEDIGELNDEELFDMEDEEDELDNDGAIEESSDYDPKQQDLLTPKSWVHVRPHILDQGRVVYFDEKRARKALNREVSLRLNGAIIEEDDFDDEDELIEEDDKLESELRPKLFSSCEKDRNDEEKHQWSPGHSSVHNRVNRISLMRSNLWPGAHSFTIDKFCDSIYLGWGLKYTSRNITISHVPLVQEDYPSQSQREILDPTVKMEKDWEPFRLKKLCLIEEEEYSEEENTSIKDA